MFILAKRQGIDVQIISSHVSEEEAWAHAALLVDAPDPTLKLIVAKSLALLTSNSEEFIVQNIKVKNPEIGTLVQFIRENNIPTEDLDELVAEKFLEYSNANDIYTQLDVLMAIMNNFPELKQEVFKLKKKKSVLQKLFG